MSRAANQFSNDLQWDPDPFSWQGMFKITDVVDALSSDDLSGSISAQWERDLVIWRPLQHIDIMDV